MDRSDARANNLEYVDQSENLLRASKMTGRHKKAGVHFDKRSGKWWTRVRRKNEEH